MKGGRSCGRGMRELPQPLLVAVYLPLRLGIGSIDQYRPNPDGVPSEPSNGTASASGSYVACMV